MGMKDTKEKTRAQVFREELMAGKWRGRAVLLHLQHYWRADGLFRVKVGRRCREWGIEWFWVEPVAGRGRLRASVSQMIEDTPEAVAEARENFDMVEEYRELDRGEPKVRKAAIQEAFGKLGGRRRKVICGLMKDAGLLRRDGRPAWSRFKVWQLRMLAKVVIRLKYGHDAGGRDMGRQPR